MSRTGNVHAGGTRIVATCVSIRTLPFGQKCCSYSLAFLFSIRIRICNNRKAPYAAIRNINIFHGGIVLCNDRKRIQMFRDRCGPSTYSVRRVPAHGVPQYYIRITRPIILSTGLISYYSHYHCSYNSYYDVPTDLYGHCNNGFISNPRSGLIIIALNVFAVMRLVHGIRVLVPMCSCYVPGGRYAPADRDPYSLFRGVGFPIGRFFPPTARKSNNKYNYTYNDGPSSTASSANGSDKYQQNY